MYCVGADGNPPANPQPAVGVEDTPPNIGGRLIIAPTKAIISRM